jgi:hypothetical protein
VSACARRANAKIMNDGGAEVLASVRVPVRQLPERLAEQSFSGEAGNCEATLPRPTRLTGAPTQFHDAPIPSPPQPFGNFFPNLYKAESEKIDSGGRKKPVVAENGLIGPDKL